MKAISKKEKGALQYAIEFLYNSFTEHKDDSVGQQIKPELKALISLNRKLKQS